PFRWEQRLPESDRGDFCFPQRSLYCLQLYFHILKKYGQHTILLLPLNEPPKIEFRHYSAACVSDAAVVSAEVSVSAAAVVSSTVSETEVEGSASCLVSLWASASSESTA